MKQTTRTGTIYRSKHLTRHYASGIGAAVLFVVGAAIVLVLAFPPILDVLR